MKRITLFLLVLLTAIPATPLQLQSYKVRNPELGIVYRTPSGWDGEQWQSVFRDTAPPMGWAILPVGTELCRAVKKDWLANVKSKGLKPALILDPFLTAGEIRNGMDCAAPLGFRRFILDEYISYHTKNLKRPLCTVISEVRSLYEYSKRKYPGIEFAIDDNWHTWIIDLGKGQADPCGSYPYFRVDLAGVSVLSKYGNPREGKCGHPTAEEMREQLIDLKQTVKDYSRTGRIFAWQLNQNWYPGGEDVLQLFRQARVLHGWERHFLWGPTTTVPRAENWGYRTATGRESCPGLNYEWYLPAREYLIRMTEGKKTRLELQGPQSVTSGGTYTYSGRILAESGIQVSGIEFRVAPAPGTTQTFRRDVTAPSSTPIAFVGLRINSQLTDDVKGAAQLSWLRAKLVQRGSSRNLVRNPDFDQELRDWLVVANSPVNTLNAGNESSVEVNATRDQFVTITSTPIPVIPGRTYTVSFDAKLFQEARVNGYFFVAWNNLKEVRRDRIYLRFEEPQRIQTVSSGSGGGFQFQWQPPQVGVFDVLAFFPGTRAFQPSVRRTKVVVN